VSETSTSLLRSRKRSKTVEQNFDQIFSSSDDKDDEDNKDVFESLTKSSTKGVEQSADFLSESSKNENNRSRRLSVKSGRINRQLAKKKRKFSRGSKLHFCHLK
jgi:hypothetical protein